MNRERIARFTMIQAVTLSLLLLLPGCNGSAAPESGSSEAASGAAQPADDRPEVASTPEPQRAAPTPTPTPAAKPPAPRPVEPPVVQRVELTIPAGTPFDVEFLDGLSSETSVIGDAFRARVVNDIAVDGRVAVGAGSEVTGVVTDVQSTKKVGGQARLAMQFDEMTLASGGRTGISAVLAVAGKKQTSKDAGTIGGSAAVGAVLGRVLDKGDKNRGTLIGAVVGAAAGTAIAANNADDPVLIDPGTVLGLTFDAPVTVSVEARR